MVVLLVFLLLLGLPIFQNVVLVGHFFSSTHGWNGWYRTSSLESGSQGKIRLKKMCEILEVYEWAVSMSDNGHCTEIHIWLCIYFLCIVNPPSSLAASSALSSSSDKLSVTSSSRSLQSTNKLLLLPENKDSIASQTILLFLFTQTGKFWSHQNTNNISCLLPNLVMIFPFHI